MRIWSLHPKYLDSRGLVALWRETLLAQNVLLGKTKGYKNHPQLIRFKQSDNPAASIGRYLMDVYEEAVNRGYNFDFSKIKVIDDVVSITVTSGQIKHEWDHLMHKLKTRDPQKYKQNLSVKRPRLHPLFKTVSGKIEHWERV